MSELTPNVHALGEYMVDRLNILKSKNAGLPKPWTKDKVLQEYRFCNVYREDDTVTIWIEQNIRKPYANHKDLWLMLALARQINWPDTLQEMIDSDYWFDKPGFSLDGLVDVMHKRQDRGEKVYTGAYMIRAESNKNAPWYHESKHWYIVNITVGKLMEHRQIFEDEFLNPARSLQSVWDLFQRPEFIGWGPFLAYEVVTDLRHTRYLKDAPDIMTWANAGPGAIRGLNRMYGRELDHQPKPEQTNAEMFKLLQELTEMNILPPLEMRDIEHNLCEFDKLSRVRTGEGRPRSRYPGLSDSPTKQPKKKREKREKVETTQDIANL